MSAFLATKPFDDEKQVQGEYDGAYPPQERRTSVVEDVKERAGGRQFSVAAEDVAIIDGDFGRLQRGLKGRHLQMIAIGGAIGAGLFVNSGAALANGGPASLVICFVIIGVMMLMMMQALGELAVMYPVNGAFYSYIVRFLDPSWGFACGWQYAIQWLTILPYEITAAGLTIDYWRQDNPFNIGIWIAVFLAILIAIQFFGVRGYGEVEFVLSIVKVLACTGFIILGIIINCGGVPTDSRGYIGGEYWRSPYSAFNNGFHGFCTVFVTASFAFGGTELTGLAAAEAADPKRQIPKATKQVFWRIAFFYIVNLLIVGLIVPANNPNLLGNGAATTDASPFVIAINLAGIPALPSIFNAVITISVISVANSATYASTRTIQAMALQGMAPKFLAYVDKKGRPIPTVILQIAFGFIAFINEAKVGATVIYWLLALSGLANFFVYGSICLSHIRFRGAWRRNGHSLDELPYQAQFGVLGSWLGFALNVICLAAQFYTAIFYLALPLILVFYFIWKIYSWFNVPAHRPLWVAADKIDIYTGMRDDQRLISDPAVRQSEPERRASIASMQEERKMAWYDYPKSVVTAFL